MSGCCRIDPIHHGGIYIPLLAPVFRCLPSPLSFFPPFPRTSVSSSPAALSPGWFLPCDRLCRHFPGGACASSLSLSLPFLPSPRLCNYQDPLATFSSRRIARRCNGHCLRVKSFDPRRNDTPPEVVARRGRLHDFWNF